MARSFQDAVTVLNGVTRASTADPVWVKVEDFRHMIFTVITSGSTTATLEVIGALKGKTSTTNAPLTPDLTTAASVTNPYAPIGMFDLNTGTGIVGTTGITLSGTDILNHYQVNTDGLTWVTVQVTAYTQGTITAFLKPFNDAV